MKVDFIDKGTSRYIVGKVERFDQKNMMFFRPLWDPSMLDLGRNYYGRKVMPTDKPGYRLQDAALVNAAYHLDDNFGHKKTGRNLDGISLYDRDWDGKFSYPNVPSGLKITVNNPAEVTKEVKKAARFFGASLVGVCELDRRWLYSYAYNPLADGDKRSEKIEMPEDYKYAVMMSIEMDYIGMNCSPARTHSGASGLGYSKMAFTAGLLAQYIRGLGYKAIPIGNHITCSIPLAIDAGLGELGRNGLLITPEFGPRVRLCEVFTDLPLVCDSSIEFGVWDFCMKCERCAEECPSLAIMCGAPTEKPSNISNREGLLRWPINAEKCFAFWAANGSACSNCVRVCPFNKPSGWLHDAVRWGVKNTCWLDSTFVKVDKLFSYGKQHNANEFWNS